MSALSDRGSTRAWRRIRAAILARDGHVCHWCGGRATTVDHLIRRTDDGADEPGNLVAACTRCNCGRRPRGRRDPRPSRIW